MKSINHSTITPGDSAIESVTLKKLSEYLPVFEKLRKMVVKDFHIQSLDALGQAYSRNNPVMTILNHSTPLSWLPAICVLIDQVAQQEGGKERIPVGVMDRFFFQNPLLKPVAGYITQFNQVASFEDVLNKLTTRECTDVAIFPEGSNCFFGPGEKIQPFRSPRFIELALLSETPILLAVHRGSEEWAKTISIQPKKIPLMAYMPGWLNEKIQRGGHLVLPVLPKPINDFRITCEFYQPQLTRADLRTTRRKKVELLWQEAAQVQNRMQEMFDSLAAS